MAAATSNEPFGGANVAMALKIEGLPEEVGLAHGTAVFYRPVTLDYFHALGMPLVAGRNFTATDFQGVDRAVIANESFARRFFGGNALGHRIGGLTPDAEPINWMAIVGVVHDTREVSMQGDPDLEYYVPFGETMTSPNMTFLARTADEPMALAAAIEKQVWSVDADAPVTDVKTMDQLVAEQVAQPKFQTLLLGAFGFLGLALAVVGIYGVISYAVTQRTREIGIRMALGAEPASVLRLIVGHGMLLAAVGIAIGAAGAFALTRYLASLLYEVRPGDPATFAAVAVGLGIVALAASYVPARRAMRVDPMVALRHE
jgi:putative ABC transport system permease protein